MAERILNDYIPLVDLINDIVGQYPRINENFPLDKSNALEWGTDCMRLLGAGIFQEFVYHAKIKDNKIKIPDNLYLIEGIYRSLDCNIQQVSWQNSHLYPLKYAGGIKSNMLCNDCCNTDISYIKDVRDTFSINKPNIIFNFTDEYVVIDYYGFVTDENGLYSYPDNPTVKQAIIDYIVCKWFYEPYIMGDIDQNRYVEIERKKIESFNRAKADFIIPNVTESRMIIEHNQNRYNKFNLRRFRYMT